MNKGEVIKGYKILHDATMTGGGMCTWTFAEKGDKEFFIKEFLSPVYPTDKSPGSPKIKEKRKEHCQVFEKYQKRIIDTVRSKCAEGGNLIFAQDFFRHGSKYYKVTDKVDVASISLLDISELELKKRILIMTTVSHSLKVLHDSNIVHGDLKPDNILIKKIDSGLKKEKDGYTTKLIDFDNSFFNENPPELTDEVVGDLAYYSPELLRYIKKTDTTSGKELTVKSDIFALGLIFSKYLTNSAPYFDKDKYQFPSVAVNNGVVLKIVSGVYPKKLESLINSMLVFKYEDRPSISSVHADLKSLLHSTEVADWKPKIKEEKSSYLDIPFDPPKGKLKFSKSFKKTDDEKKDPKDISSTSRVRLGKNLRK